MKEIERILKDDKTEETIQKITALSDLLVSASTTRDLPTHETINYIAIELLTAAKVLQRAYGDLLKATVETDQGKQ